MLGSLEQSGIVELQRSQLADTFQVEISQINLWIKTRFCQRVEGTLVEVQRGGGAIFGLAELTKPP